MHIIWQKTKTKYCVKSVRIRSYSGPYFPAFVLNTEIYGISLRIQSECGKILSRITPNTSTFYAVFSFCFLPNNMHFALSSPKRILSLYLSIRLAIGGIKTKISFCLFMVSMETYSMALVLKQKSFKMI